MSTLQADNKKYQSVGTRSRGCSTWKMQSSPENTYVAFAACVVQQCYVLGTDYTLLEVACTDSSVRRARCGLRAAFVWLCKSETIENHVLYHASVVSRCTSKAVSLPAAVLRDVLWLTALSKTYSRLCIH